MQDHLRFGRMIATSYKNMIMALWTLRHGSPTVGSAEYDLRNLLTSRQTVAASAD